MPPHQPTASAAQGAAKTALISGQDGSDLAELLLAKGYTVHGIKRRASQFNNWSHARMRWLMLQRAQPRDHVMATGQQASVRTFLTLATAELGIPLAFEGQGQAGRAVVAVPTGDAVPALKVGDVIVRVDPRYDHDRPAEAQTLLGDASRARQAPGWTPQTTLPELVREMVAHDLAEARAQALLRHSGWARSSPAP
ncbi:MAG: hypothetical protein OHK0048_02990 [Rhodoferax sp.]